MTKISIDINTCLQKMESTAVLLLFDTYQT
jgi:hypothetical protein